MGRNKERLQEIEEHLADAGLVELRAAVEALQKQVKQQDLEIADLKRQMASTSTGLKTIESKTTTWHEAIAILDARRAEWSLGSAKAQLDESSKGDPDRQRDGLND